MKLKKSLFDDLEPTHAVSVSITPGLREIWISFARIPDREVINELTTQIKSKPGFSLFDLNEVVYIIRFNGPYRLPEIAEKIVEFLESHNLTVKRCEHHKSIEKEVQRFA